MTDDSRARYPLGPQPSPQNVTPQDREQAISAIAALPAELRSAVAGLSEAQLDTPYREGGWTVRQVVHHVPDSHMNAYLRIKLALTEDQPIIKPYEEAEWARLPDSRLPLAPSLELLTGLHQRWAALLTNLTEAQWARRFVHPASQQTFSVAQASLIYQWHGLHHTAQILRLREQRGW